MRAAELKQKHPKLYEDFVVKRLNHGYTKNFEDYVKEQTGEVYEVDYTPKKNREVSETVKSFSEPVKEIPKEPVLSFLERKRLAQNKYMAKKRLEKQALKEAHKKTFDVSRPAIKKDKEYILDEVPLISLSNDIIAGAVEDSKERIKELQEEEKLLKERVNTLKRTYKLLDKGLDFVRDIVNVNEEISNDSTGKKGI